MGILAPTAWNFAGSWRNSLISPSSSIASSHPATSANVFLGMSFVISFAFDLANCMTPRPPPPCTLFISHRNTRMMKRKGRTVIRIPPRTLGLGTSVVYLSMLPASTCACTAFSRLGWVSLSQYVMTLLPPERSTSSSRVALICCSPPSTNVSSETWPLAM